MFAFVANYYRLPRKFTAQTIVPLLGLGATGMHVFFLPEDAAVLRYSAYIVGFGLWTLWLALADLWPRKFDLQHVPAYALLVLLAPTFFGHLRVRHNWLVNAQPIDLASSNIYSQQYQMGLFVQRYYDDGAVAVNDIGAVSYLSNAQTIDVWGLGNREVADLRLDDAYDVDEMASIVREAGADIAIVYNDWINDSVGAVPVAWIPVGHWDVVTPIILGSPQVTFYATHDAAVAPLIANLQDFKDRLPYPEVFQSGRYITDLENGQ